MKNSILKILKSNNIEEENLFYFRHNFIKFIRYYLIVVK